MNVAKLHDACGQLEKRACLQLIDLDDLNDLLKLVVYADDGLFENDEELKESERKSFIVTMRNIFERLGICYLL
jgi:hypothetical protein